MSITGRELRSLLDADGGLTLSLETVTTEAPGDREVVVQIEASPLNPSDLGLMLPGVDLTAMKVLGTATAPILKFEVPDKRLAALRGRIGLSLSVGNEGAGTVVAAGSGAESLLGRRVALFGGATYADYRLTSVDSVVVLPEGLSAAEGASFFVNPLTALGFVETARRDGHKAIVHTAAASNLGQMLQRICLKDGVPLINIVRSEEQAAILRGIGATEIINSQDQDYQDRLADALERTGATAVFDAIGGGTLGTSVLQSMERGAVAKMPTYDRYGSGVFKQLYIYGGLDLAATTFSRPAIGFNWGISGWLLLPFLQRVGPEVMTRMRDRILNDLTTTFSSHYTQIISLAEALQPETLRSYERKATGEKYLIDPTRG